VLRWNNHEIKGEGSYLRPWTEISTYASNVADRLKARFPTTPLLEALSILNPQEWEKHRDPQFNSGIPLSTKS
jgi:hypothetical protein